MVDLGYLYGLTQHQGFYGFWLSAIWFIIVCWCFVANGVYIMVRVEQFGIFCGFIPGVVVGNCRNYVSTKCFQLAVGLVCCC